jgi:hypothetical protein
LKNFTHVLFSYAPVNTDGYAEFRRFITINTGGFDLAVRPDETGAKKSKSSYAAGEPGSGKDIE